MTKECTKCGGIKELSEFYKHKTTKYGHSSTCKKCDNKKNKEWYHNNKDKAKKLQVKWRENNNTYYQKGRSMLIDSYIVGQLHKCFNIPSNLITFELINSKRKQLQAFRLHKQIKEVME